MTESRHSVGTQSVGSFDRARLIASLFHERHPELQRLCIRWARGHHADAEDLLAEACLRAIQASQRGGAPLENPIGWLSTIVRNLARDRRRTPDISRRAEAAPETWHDLGPDALDSFEAKELLARATAELRCLPGAQRRSLLARAAGDDYPAIADVLGTSPENARKLVQTARSTLRERLGLGAGASAQAT
jgi:RNA polymerase sigma factor (sigma-70 family)